MAVRTTVDIADADYALLKARAALQRTSVKALIRDSIIESLQKEHIVAKRKVLPVIGSASSKRLELNHERVNELLLDLP